MKLVLFGAVLAVFIILNVLPNVEGGAGAVSAQYGRAQHCTGELKLYTISSLDSKNKKPLRQVTISMVSKFYKINCI